MAAAALTLLTACHHRPTERQNASIAAASQTTLTTAHPTNFSPATTGPGFARPATTAARATTVALAVVYGHASPTTDSNLTKLSLEQGNRTVQTTSTDGDGTYRFSNVAPGHYALTMSNEGRGGNTCSTSSDGGKVCLAPAVTVDSREIDVAPGEQHREDW